MNECVNLVNEYICVLMCQCSRHTNEAFSQHIQLTPSSQSQNALPLTRPLHTHTQAGGAPNLKLLEAAMRWKRQKMAAEGGGDGGGGDGGGGGGAAADG